MPRQPIIGTRFKMAYREPAWYGLGKSLATDVTASVAVQAAHLDTRIDVLPLDIPYNREIIHVSDDKVLIRAPSAGTPTPRLLGIASPNYTVLQTAELAALLDPLTQRYPVVLAGEQRDGESVAFVLRGERRSLCEVLALRDYWLITDQRNGRSALTLCYIPLVENNTVTLSTGVSSTTALLSVRHGKALRAALPYQLNAVGPLDEAGARLAADMDKLSAVKLHEEAANALVAAAYFTPKQPEKAALLAKMRAGVGRKTVLVPVQDDADTDVDMVLQSLEEAEDQHEWRQERLSEARATALDLWREYGAQRWPSLRGTALLLWLVVCEIADFRDGGRAENLAVEAIYGTRAAEKARAYKAIAARYLTA